MQLVSQDHGTKTVVHDLFGNMPVRVRQRPTGDPGFRIREKEWNSTCRIVTGMILSIGRPVFLTMKGFDKEHVYRVKTSSKAFPSSRSATVKDNNQSTFDTALIRSTLTQGAHLDPVSWCSWIKTSAKTSSITVRAVISLDPGPSKQLQFLALGGRFIPAIHGHNILYDTINQQFMDSSFAVREANPGKRAGDNRFTNKQLKGTGRDVDRWPMFFIRVDTNGQQSFNSEQSHEGFEEGKKLNAVAEVLKTMVTGFLKEHHLRPHNRRDAGERMPPRKAALNDKEVVFEVESTQAKNEQKRRREQNLNKISNGIGDLNMEVKFPSVKRSEWSAMPEDLPVRSRIKTSSSCDLRSLLHTNSLQATKEVSSHFTSSSSTLLPHSNAAKDSTLSTNTCEEAAAPDIDVPQEVFAGLDGVVEWTHPVTKELLLLNARTGCAINPGSRSRPSSVDETALRAGKNGNPDYTQKRIIRTSSGIAPPKEGSWASAFFETWENPIFQKSEEAIPRVSLEDLEDELRGFSGRVSSSYDRSFQHYTASSHLRLSKKNLGSAYVISQVESKFILILAQSQSTDTRDSPSGLNLLVLVDQHAVDERVKVEALLSELCAPSSSEQKGITSPLGHRTGVETKSLPRPIFFEIHSRENAMFRRHAAYFATWGILYDLVSTHTGPSTLESQSLCRLVVLTLPPMIAERCRVEPKLLVEILRGEAWRREETEPRKNSLQKSNSSQQDTTEAMNWLQRITDCPQGILDMLNSRSCRSAIMFNDDLSRQQCGDLLKDLSSCHFPFQCAHGRPTMVPLVDLGGLHTVGNHGESLGSRSRKVVDFRAAWEVWAQSN